MTKCYVWNCHRKAVIFIELTTSPYDRMPTCQKHADQFPEHYPRVEGDRFGKGLNGKDWSPLGEKKL